MRGIPFPYKHTDQKIQSDIGAVRNGGTVLQGDLNFINILASGTVGSRCEMGIVQPDSHRKRPAPYGTKARLMTQRLLTCLTTQRTAGCVSVCVCLHVCVCEREKKKQSVCVCVREREREIEREREKQRVCVCVCACERELKIEREKEREERSHVQ